MPVGAIVAEPRAGSRQGMVRERAALVRACYMERGRGLARIGLVPVLPAGHGQVGKLLRQMRLHGQGLRGDLRNRDDRPRAVQDQLQGSAAASNRIQR